MASNIKPLGLTLGPLLWTLTKALRILLKQEDIPYTFDQIIILRIVRECKEDVVQQDIADKLNKDKSVILRAIDSLENDGLIRRIVDPADRRRNILEITYQGNQLMNRFYDIEMKATQELLKDLTDDEINVFFNTISKIKTQIDNM